MYSPNHPNTGDFMKISEMPSSCIRIRLNGKSFFMKLTMLLLLAVTFVHYQQLHAKPLRLVIAHRGASAYLPEHTLAAKAMAHAMGADYVELDVVLSRDDRLLVLHDLSLNATTNVEQIYPQRKRDDGKHYAIDFTLAEIRKLSVHERLHKSGTRPKYPRRFPVDSGLFRLNTLEEEIELLRGLSRSTGREVGLFIELKSPEWHARHGKDIVRKVLNLLDRYGYKDKSDPVWLQSFSADSLKRVRFELKSRLRILQLIGENRWGISNTDFEKMKTRGGLAEVATYAEGIGPWLNQVISGINWYGEPELSGLFRDAKALGLQVIPYTFRADNLPAYVADFEELLEVFLIDAQVEGVFTDFPDLVVQFLETRGLR